MPDDLDIIPYLGDEQLIISIDVGNFASSVSLVHLQYGRPPNKIRNVTQYPGQGASSRTPSAIAYDGKERPRAFGTECFEPGFAAQAAVDGWIIVTGFKDQMIPVDKSSKDKMGGERKKSSRMTTEEDTGEGLTTSRTLTRSPTLPEIPGRLASRVESEVKESKKKKSVGKYEGPTLKLVYCDIFKHLVESARAWLSETSTDGDATWQRLESTCVFVVAHPSDWGRSDTDLMRRAIQTAKLLPSEFSAGRLVFVKESAASVYFVKKYSKDPASTWLEPGSSFVLCDAADTSASIIGYTVATLTPRMKLRPFETLSRLPVGSSTVSAAFSAFVTKKLAKTKFKSPDHLAAIMEQFEHTVKPKFSGIEEDFEIKFASGGNDATVGIKDGRIIFAAWEIEDAYRSFVDAFIIRLSSIVPRGQAKAIVLVGGFGESPYLQRRLKSIFERPNGVQVIIPDIPAYTAVSEGAARFYLTETISPRPTLFDLGVASAVDWSTNWSKLSERDTFSSVSGSKYILGKWTPIVPKGKVFDWNEVVSKSYNVKYDLESSSPAHFSIDLFAHDPSSLPLTDSWMTDIKGKSYESFEGVCNVSADLSTLVALCPVNSIQQSSGVTRRYVVMDIELQIYIGARSLEARVSWMEEGLEVRGAASVIEDRFF